jgi:hypothetical protein
MAEAEKAWPQSSSVIAFTFRVETPYTYILAGVATSACSERLADLGLPYLIRVLLVPGVTDTEANLRAIARRAGRPGWNCCLTTGLRGASTQPAAGMAPGL